MLQETTIGSMNFNVLRSLIKQGNFIRNGLGAEVGVLYADTSSYLLEEFPNLCMLCIDPYLEYAEPGADRTQGTLNKYEEIARQKLACFPNRAQMVKELSLNAAPMVQDGSLDFVFIDANHEYEHVLADLVAWYPKVRSQGLFCGHDYNSWPGVKRAVDEFKVKMQLHGYCTPLTSDVWFFVKP